MEEKTYKARVEVSMIIEMEIQAVHEDNAAAVAEECALMNAEKMADDIRSYGCVQVPNFGVRVIEVEEK